MNKKLIAAVFAAFAVSSHAGTINLQCKLFTDGVTNLRIGDKSFVLDANYGGTVVHDRGTANVTDDFIELKVQPNDRVKELAINEVYRINRDDGSIKLFLVSAEDESQEVLKQEGTCTKAKGKVAKPKTAF